MLRIPGRQNEGARTQQMFGTGVYNPKTITTTHNTEQATLPHTSSYKMYDSYAELQKENACCFPSIPLSSYAALMKTSA